jgi:hypothetical protein
MLTAHRSAAGTVLMNSHPSRARVEDPGRPDRAGRPAEVNIIVMPVHHWTLAYTWQAE